MTELRRQVGSAGLGQRLANSWSDRHYPRWRPEPSRRAPRPDLVAPERPEGVPVVRDVGEREARILERAGPDVEVVAS
jgi:hypothetical protein